MRYRSRIVSYGSPMISSRANPRMLNPAFEYIGVEEVGAVGCPFSRPLKNSAHAHLNC